MYLSRFRGGDGMRGCISWVWLAWEEEEEEEDSGGRVLWFFRRVGLWVSSRIWSGLVWSGLSVDLVYLLVWFALVSDVSISVWQVGAGKVSGWVCFSWEYLRSPELLASGIMCSSESVLCVLYPSSKPMEWT